MFDGCVGEEGTSLELVGAKWSHTTLEVSLYISVFVVLLFALLEMCACFGELRECVPLLYCVWGWICGCCCSFYLEQHNGVVVGVCITVL